MNCSSLLPQCDCCFCTDSISQVSETVPIWLDDLRCGRNNTALLNCPHSGLGVEDCTHSEDVGVACAPRSDCDGEPVHVQELVINALPVSIANSLDQ